MECFPFSGYFVKLHLTAGHAQNIRLHNTQVYNVHVPTDVQQHTYCLKVVSSLPWYNCVRYIGTCGAITVNLCEPNYNLIPKINKRLELSLLELSFRGTCTVGVVGFDVRPVARSHKTQNGGGGT